MGMTIDEAIEIFKEIKYPTNGDNEYEREKAIQIMIKAVRKYQKIEQAYSAYLETMNPETLADLISTII